MAKTTFLGIDYPDENQDPFYESYEAQMQQMDQIIFMQKVMNNLFLSGGGTRTWNGGSGSFSWSADFVIPVFHWGKKINVQFGPDNMNRFVAIPDGSALVVTIPFVMNENITVNFAAPVAQLTQQSHSQWVAGWRYGSVLYLKGIGELT